jgi:hypothetical protein
VLEAIVELLIYALAILVVLGVFGRLGDRLR